MMTILPIRNPLALADNSAAHGRNTGFVPVFQGGSPVPSPTFHTLFNGNTGIIPPFMNGGLVPGPIAQAVAGTRI